MGSAEARARRSFGTQVRHGLYAEPLSKLSLTSRCRRTTAGECSAFHVERYSARIDCADLPVGPRQIGQGLRCLPHRAALTY